MITFNKVQIGHKQALASVEVETLEKGQMVALIGSNGSGKTTLLHTISGQISPLSGEITYENTSLSTLKKRELAKLIAFVPARFPETEFLNVRDFIGLGRIPYLNQLGILTDSNKQIVERIINQLGISHLAEKQTNELSDGERQLCSVARALAQETPILLLDEPTGYLDYKNKRKLLSILAEITSIYKLITFFSTHDLETVMALNINLIGIHSKRTNKQQIPVVLPIDKNLSVDEIVDDYYR